MEAGLFSLSKRLDPPFEGDGSSCVDGSGASERRARQCRTTFAFSSSIHGSPRPALCKSRQDCGKGKGLERRGRGGEAQSFAKEGKSRFPAGMTTKKAKARALNAEGAEVARRSLRRAKATAHGSRSPHPTLCYTVSKHHSSGPPSQLNPQHASSHAESPHAVWRTRLSSD